MVCVCDLFVKKLALKMTVSKRWIPKILTESEEHTDKINWQSSSSSDESEDFTKPKKMKLGQADTRNSYVSKVYNNYECKTTSPLPKNRRDSSEISVVISPSPIIGVPRIKNESPIITRGSVIRTFESLSPIQSCNVNTSQLSPIITDKKIRKKTLCKKEIKRKIVEPNELSQDIFIPSSSQIIEEIDSPDSDIRKALEDSPEFSKIETITSQDTSSLDIINASTSETSLQTSECFKYYHQPNSKKKFNRKDGFLNKLQKTLVLHDSRVSLWHHDIFCEKIIASQLDHLNGIVKSKQKEYGCVILECSENGSRGINILNEYFLVSLGHNISPNVLCDVGLTIKVFPPFKEKIVHFKNKDIKFFYNVSKILTETEQVQLNNFRTNGQTDKFTTLPQ